MTDFNFKIVGKDGKVIEDLSFNDFDAVADYMLDAADRWYAGLEDSGSTMSVERRENGEVVYKDESSFGGLEIGPGTEAELDRDLEEIRQTLGASELPRIENLEDS
jgi:hypothetical protein